MFIKIYFSAFLFCFSLIQFSLFSQDQNQTEIKNEKTRKNQEFTPEKRSMSEKDISRKKESWYFTGLPLVSFDPVAGVGFGVRVFFFENGTKDDAIFDYAPYFHRVYGQFFLTTNGKHFHTINWDAPYLFRLFNRWVRIRSELNYDDNPIYNYYGVGNDTARPLTFTSNGFQNSIQDINEFEKAVEEFGNSDGNTAIVYNKVRVFRPTWIIAGESDIFYIWGGAFRVTAGLNIQYVQVDDYTGDQFELFDEDGKSRGNFAQLPTKFRQDSLAGRIYGSDISWNNTVRLAVSFDNRDFEPDPNRGTFTDFTMEFAPQFLGSRFGYTRYNLTTRIYYDPIPNYENFVLTARGAYYFVIGERTPFYTFGNVLFSDALYSSGGGLRTMRGYRNRRLAGKATALFNFEIRWTVWNAPAIWKQQFSFIVVPFLDVGRSFDGIEFTNASDWALSYGGGVRIAWNQATIIAVDIGFSDEGYNLYVNFNHIY